MMISVFSMRRYRHDALTAWRRARHKPLSRSRLMPRSPPGNFWKSIKIHSRLVVLSRDGDETRTASRLNVQSRSRPLKIF